MEVATAPQGTAERPEPVAGPEPLAGRVAVTLGAAVLGFGGSISVFLKAYYDLDVWGWIGLGLLVVAIALLVGWRRPRGVAFPLAIGGLVALWLWSLLSSVWADS